ncbi:MAG: hypothetical protein JRH11_08485 [Deltaproteobacteria bacterium]|nr:hypothetical protein [Deltaproteobacteria bacterium]
MSYRSLTLVLLLALGCAAAGPADGLGDPAAGLGGKADNAAPSAPFPIPDSYRLPLPLEESPSGGADFTFCSNVERFVLLPLVLDVADAEAECDTWFGRACWREPEAGEVTDTAGWGPVMMSDDDDAELTWALGVTAPGEAGGPGTIEAGLYTVDVRLPVMHGAGDLRDRSVPRAAKYSTYTIRHATGEDETEIDLTIQAERARWVGLGVFRFDAGAPAELTVKSGRDPIPAGSVRFRRVTDPNLDNAAWLGYLASNQYAHFWDVGPLLETFGFGEPGEGAYIRQCAEDRRQLRWDEYQARLAGRDLTEPEVTGIGACVADWWATDHAEEARQTDYSLTASFEHFLIQTPRPERNIEFFSGGERIPGALEMTQGSTQVFLAQHPERNMVLIAIRGTEMTDDQAYADAGADAKMWLSALQDPFDADWGEVHSGFRDELASIEDLIFAKLEHIAPDTQIFITGHSLGGALATLLSARILAELAGDPERYFLRGVYTFGSPRVGSHAFAARYHELSSRFGVQVMRVRHANDIVTRIPLTISIPFTRWKLLDYQHVGAMLYIHPDGENYEMAPARVSNSIGGNAIDAHRMPNYYRHLRAAVNTTQFDHMRVCPPAWDDE